MDPKLKNYIVEDAKEFFASESWYAERGLPFRRGVSQQMSFICPSFGGSAAVDR